MASDSLVSAPQLPFQQIHFVGQHGFAIPEKRDDDAEPHGGFSGRVGNNEERENLAVHGAEQPRESHQVDIQGIQDQLDGHQNHDDVSPRQHSDHRDYN